jgi:hypothetical protein
MDDGENIAVTISNKVDNAIGPDPELWDDILSQFRHDYTSQGAE